MSKKVYELQRPAYGQPSWTARYRLPEELGRGAVLDEIDRSIQAIRYVPDIPLKKVALRGMSGVLLGPKGDHDAEQVRDVVFATDPSRKYGIRPPHYSDRHAYRTALVNGWREVDIDGNELSGEIEEVTERKLARVIMGRNLDKYEGKEVATYEEARSLLPRDTDWETQGGYLFSGRPNMKLYHEAAIVITMDADKYTLDHLEELCALAHGLNDQDRFVLELPRGAEVFGLVSR